MNVDLIYQLQRDDAFADQLLDGQYRSFVAMPFSSRGGYPAKRIRELLKKVHDLANEQREAAHLPRSFAPLQRVDDGDPVSLVITEEIIRMILGSHFFIGDLTGDNNGVLLESGIALALKPNARVLLFTQDGPSGLHFDLRVTKVMEYSEDDLVSKLATSLIAAAKSYEDEAARYVNLVSSQISPAAHMLLNIFGRMYKGRKVGTPLPSLYDGNAAILDDRFKGDYGRISFETTAAELVSRRLMWTHWDAGVGEGGNADRYGMHATKLGWRVIEHIWNHDPSMIMPPDAMTCPNQPKKAPRLAFSSALLADAGA